MDDVIVVLVSLALLIILAAAASGLIVSRIFRGTKPPAEPERALGNRDPACTCADEPDELCPVHDGMMIW